MDAAESSAIIVILIALLCGFGGFGLVRWGWRRKLRRVAAEFGGRLIEDGWLGRPAIVCPCGQGEARVQFRHIWEGPVTEMHLDLPVQLHPCEILPRLWYRNLQSLVSRNYHLLDSPSFDAEFLLRANDPEQAKLLLDFTMQQALLRIRAELGPNFQAVVRGRLLTLRIANWLDAAPLTRILELILPAAAAVGAAQAAGIEFVESAADPSPLRCPVCQDEIPARSLVWCRTCHTPHHAECWRFTKLCSRFGCSETRFQRRRSKLSASGPGAPQSSN